MRSEELERRWDEMREDVAARWDRLTEEDLDQIGGDVERLMSALRERYEYGREEAESAAQELVESLMGEEPADPLREKTLEMQATVGKAAEDVLEQLRQAADEITQQMRATADDIAGHLRQAAKEVSAEAQSTAEIAAARVEERVVESPWTSLAAAFGIGFLLGLILKR